jgi:hypothetical protein
MRGRVHRLARGVMHGLRATASIWALGCVRPPSVLPAAPHPSDAPFVEGEHLPYAPRPEPGRPGDDSAAIALTGGEEQARSTALAMVEAMLDADAATLHALFAERVVYVVEGVERPSAELIGHCLQEARSLAYEPGLHLSSVVSPKAIAVRRADAYHARLPMPSGISPNDWVVTLPPPSSGNETIRRVPCLRTLYVRPGPRSLIIGVVR